MIRAVIYILGVLSLVALAANLILSVLRWHSARARRRIGDCVVGEDGVTRCPVISVEGA